MNPDQDRLPSKPLRNWLLAWHIHTGDPPEVIAKGFDLDPFLVADILSGDLSMMMNAVKAVTIARKLRLDPETIWPERTRVANWIVEPGEPGHAKLLAQIGGHFKRLA